MSRKNLWVNDVFEMLKERAMTSTEISYTLKQMHRYPPHARKVTLVLRGRKDNFRELDKINVSSTLRRDSHKVCLWGLGNTKYEYESPYNAINRKYI